MKDSEQNPPLTNVKVYEFGNNIKTNYVALEDYKELENKYETILGHAILGRAIEFAYKNGFNIKYEFGVFFLVINGETKGSVKEWYIQKLNETGESLNM